MQIEVRYRAESAKSSFRTPTTFFYKATLRATWHFHNNLLRWHTLLAVPSPALTHLINSYPPERRTEGIRGGWTALCPAAGLPRSSAALIPWPACKTRGPSTWAKKLHSYLSAVSRHNVYIYLYSYVDCYNKWDLYSTPSTQGGREPRALSNNANNNQTHINPLEDRLSAVSVQWQDITIYIMLIVYLIQVFCKAPTFHTRWQSRALCNNANNDHAHILTGG